MSQVSEQESIIIFRITQPRSHHRPRAPDPVTASSQFSSVQTLHLLFLQTKHLWWVSLCQDASKPLLVTLLVAAPSSGDIPACIHTVWLLTHCFWKFIHKDQKHWGKSQRLAWWEEGQAVCVSVDLAYVGPLVTVPLRTPKPRCRRSCT